VYRPKNKFTVFEKNNWVSRKKPLRTVCFDLVKNKHQNRTKISFENIVFSALLLVGVSALKLTRNTNKGANT
jgi:hypothetical protein